MILAKIGEQRGGGALPGTWHPEECPGALDLPSDGVRYVSREGCQGGLMPGSLRGGLEAHFSGGATLPLRLFSMSGSDSRLPAAQSLAASPFTDPPFPARPGPPGPQAGTGQQLRPENEERIHSICFGEIQLRGPLWGSPALAVTDIRRAA